MASSTRTTTAGQATASQAMRMAYDVQFGARLPFLRIFVFICIQRALCFVCVVT